MTYKTGTWGEKAKIRARKRNEYFRKYRYTRNKIKINARNLVFNRIKNGKMIKGLCNIGIDCKGRLEAHHEDYTKPLEVIWLCTKHHREADKKLGLRK